MIQKSDDNGRPLKGLSIIKELKKKIKVLEEKRNYDRSMTTWQELKTLKKEKLKMKDELNNITYSWLKKSFPIEGEYRLCVYKSAKHIEAQIIDDFSQNTIVAASSKEKVYSGKKVNKTELASLVGESLAERAKSKKVISVYFDRNGFKYHGRVRSLAEASRKGGLKF